MRSEPWLVVDEGSFWTWATAAEYGPRLRQFFDVLGDAVQRQQGWRYSTFWLDTPIADGMTLPDLVWNRETPLGFDKEFGDEVAALLNAAEPPWDSAPAACAELEATVGGVLRLAPSVIWAASKTLDGHPTACLALPGAGAGPKVAAFQGTTASVYFVDDRTSHKQFFRDLALSGSEATLIEVGQHAFPDLDWAEGVWGGLGDFSAPFVELKDKIVRHLSVLSDHGAWIFTQDSPRLSRSDTTVLDGQTPSRQVIERRFVGYGLSCGPEAADVEREKRCREARTKKWNGRTLYCHWHTKLAEHKDRIHFHPPVVLDSKGKLGPLVVGVFHRHLPLPGD